jgi:hypothetical protein
MRRLMVLMFAWLAFAGTMNATRRGIMVYDWFGSQNPMLGRGQRIVIINGQMMSAAAGTVAPVPPSWWLELGGWSVLGLLGVWGVIASAWMATTTGREKRLMALLVLGFIAYWGYHGFQFAVELAARL